jgi:hypothetical protein
MKMPRGFKGIWIPKEIWLHEELTIKEKTFLAEINSLIPDDKEYCWASNEHFAQFSGLSKNAASKTISTLKNKGFIDVELIYSGKEIKERRIYVLQYGGYGQNDRKSTSKKAQGGYSQNDKGCSQNDKGSNTINNTYNRVSLRDTCCPSDANLNNVDSKSTAKPINRKKLKPKRNSLKRSTTLAKEKEVLHEPIPKRIIELIEYWNSFDSLSSLRIKYGRRTVWYDEQSKIMRSVVDSLKLILTGKFYNKLNIEKKFLPRKVTLSKLRMAIERCGRACSPEYSRRPFRMKFTQFIQSEGTPSEGNSKYRLIYPLIHFLINEPKPITTSSIKIKTKYPKTVERVLTVVGIKQDNHAYNRIAKYIEPAIDMLKAKSNGNFQSNLGEVPKRIAEGVSGPLTMDNIHFGFMNLERTFRKHGKIK